jgi:carbohydrate-selective porin OprB
MAKTIPRWYGTILGAATAFLLLIPLSTALGGTPGSTTQPDVAPTASGFDNNMTGDWWGLRQRLQDAGITVGAILMLEGFRNFEGGIDTAHSVGATTFDLNLALDTDKLLHWHGGEFYVDLEDHAFRNPSTALVGIFRYSTS